MSALWAGLPLIGWSYYLPEGLKVSCSIEWENHSANVLSYNITIMVFAFFIPVIIMSFTNIETLKLVSSHIIPTMFTINSNING